LTTASTAIDLANELTAGLGPWRRRAACRRADVSLFFPEKDGAAGARTEAAKAICRGCAVWAECYRWAIAANEDHGTAGGMTVRDRREVRKAMALGSDHARDRFGDGDRRADAA
jgi:WhiB family redox-sensing transcriptional regulator